MNLDIARELHALGGRAAEIAAPYLPPPAGARGLSACAQWFTVTGTPQDTLKVGKVWIEWDADGSGATWTFAEVHEAVARAKAAEHFAAAGDGTPLRVGTRVSLRPAGRGARLGTVTGYDRHPEAFCAITVRWDDASAESLPTSFRAFDLCRPAEATLLAAEIRLLLHDRAVMSVLRERVVTSACEDLLHRVATFLETP